MNTDNKHFNELIKLILPGEIFNYFEIVEVKISGEKEAHVYLDELDIKPDGYEKEKLTSKGFHASSVIQDFPLRERAMFLHVRRRRWLVESSGEVVSRNWDTVAKGTHLTKGFATFLKGIFGQLPHK
jgi:hypothetical protein